MYCVFPRDWSDSHRRLDFVSEPGAFVTWRGRARVFLARGHPDMDKVLSWAKKETEPIDETTAAERLFSEGVPERALGKGP